MFSFQNQHVGKDLILVIVQNVTVVDLDIVSSDNENIIVITDFIYTMCAMILTL